MKWRSVQVRFIAARRGAVLAAVAVAGLAPAAGAQGGAPAPTPDALCRCFVGDDSTGARSGGRGWALLGAAGLALLAGVTRLGGYVVAAWLTVIAISLLTTGRFFDVAVRDLVMAAGAFTLARLSEVRGRAPAMALKPASA